MRSQRSTAKTGIQAADDAKLKPISDMASKIGSSGQALVPFGWTKARISAEFLENIQCFSDGNVILITASSPSPDGESKTTTVSLGGGLNYISKRAMAGSASHRSCPASAEEERKLEHGVATARAAVGSELRAVRQSLNLNLTELADKVGLSVGMISKIEHGKVAASAETLVSIAEKLGVPFLSFFDRIQKVRPCYFIPSGQRIRLSRDNFQDNALQQLKGQWISDMGLMELHHVFLSGDAEPSFSRQAGIAFIYALSGKLQYKHGERNYVLQPGDALYFDAHFRHGVISVDEAPASYLLWRMYPTPKGQA